MNTRPTHPKPSYTSALLLTTREDMAAVDRRALREAGIRAVRVASSGVEAARELANSAQNQDIRLQSSMVLCNEQLSDMTGDAFVRLVRLHPLLLPFPIIVASSKDSVETRRMAVASGYSGLVSRPYTLNQLLEQLTRAEECRSATTQAMAHTGKADITAFENALKRLSDTLGSDTQNSDQLFRDGMLCLRQRHWDAGISLLQQTLKINPRHADAVLALAAAWRGKGNEGKSRVMLREAIAILADLGAWDKAVTNSARLMQEYPEAGNPLIEEAGRLVVSEQFDSAAKAIEAARKLNQDADLYEILARACAATANPLQAVRTLGRYFAETGDDAFEALLQQRLQQHLQNLGDTGTLGKGVSGSAAGATISLPIQSAKPEKSFWSRKKNTSQNLPNEEKKIVIAPLKEPASSAFLEEFPLLRDAWAVARITAALFRHLK